MEHKFPDIPFGANPTDHFFRAEYKNGRWKDPRITPFQSLILSPLALCFHYGQTVFEGLKAYKRPDGTISIFRLRHHQQRMNRSLERMAMPLVPEEIFIRGVQDLVKREQNRIPDNPEGALYLRPVVIATEPRIGVKISDEYLFYIVAMPMGRYYAKNLKVKVETEFSRAAEGGTGAAKCGGNYGGAFFPTRRANEEGFDQVLWTDAQDHLYIEESGTMNVMFAINGVLITPPSSGTILDGVTRNTLITLAGDLKIPLEERRISYRELEQAFRDRKTIEAFGVGTAAVVSPIESIHIEGTTYKTDVSEKAIQFRLKRELYAIRSGEKQDVYGWNDIISIPSYT